MFRGPFIFLATFSPIHLRSKQKPKNCRSVCSSLRLVTGLSLRVDRKASRSSFVAVGKWETCFWFSTFPRPASAGAAAFPQLSFWRVSGFGDPPPLFTLPVAFRLLILLGVLHPVTRDVQL